MEKIAFNKVKSVSGFNPKLTEQTVMLTAIRVAGKYNIAIKVTTFIEREFLLIFSAKSFKIFVCVFAAATMLFRAFAWEFKSSAFRDFNSFDN